MKRPAARRPRRRAPWLSSVRRRPATFVTLLVLACLAVAVSTLGPVLLRAAQAAFLAESVQRASAVERSVTSVAQAGDADGLIEAAQTAEGTSAALTDPRLWHAPVTALATSQTLPWRISTSPSTAVSGLLSFTPHADCRGLRLVEGVCPVTTAQVALPRSAALRLHAALRSTVTVRPGEGGNERALRVVGVYDDASGYGRILASPERLVGPAVRQPSPGLLVGQQGELDFGVDYLAYSAQRVRMPVLLDDLPRIQEDITAARSTALTAGGAGEPAAVRSQLDGLLTRVGVQLDAAAVLTSATAIEAIVLAWFALAVAIGRISRVRAVEWGIGRTRGSRRSVWLTTVFLEPVLAIVTGSVVGFLLGAGLARLAGSIVLGPAVPEEPFRPVVLVSAAVTLLGSLVALVAASVRSATLPLPALLRETTEPRQLSRLALVAQVGVVLVTAVVLWALLTQPRITGAQVALLAPILIALVVGIAALRIAVIAVRRATMRSPTSLTGLVVLRGLARTPSTLTAAVMVAVGLALATSVLALSVTADRLQDQRAEAQVGATTVLHVTTPSGTSILDAVRRADPGGRQAMAARELAGAGVTGTARLVAVDSMRLAAVTTWRPSWRGRSPATLQRRLDPPTGAGLTIRGTRMSIAVRKLQPRDRDQDTNLRLGAVLATPSGWQDADFGLIRDGVLSSTVPCVDGCRLVSLALEDPVPSSRGPFGYTFVISTIGTDAMPSSAFTSWTDGRRTWRQRLSDQTDPELPASAGAQGGDLGLLVDMEADSGGAVPAIEPAAGPTEVPALLAARTDAQPFSGLPDVVFGSDLNDVPLLLESIGTAPVLPRSLNDGALVDLSQLQRLSDPTGRQAVDEVWLGPGRHTAVLAALRAQGVRVRSTQTLAGRQALNRRDAPVRSLALLLITAAAALALTFVSLVGVRIVSAPARRPERQALADAGVGDRTLGRLAAVEFAAPAALGVVLGTVAGVIAVLLTVSRLPLLVGTDGGPPLDLHLPVVAVLALLVGALLLVGVVSGVVLLLGSRRSAA